MCLGRTFGRRLCAMLILAAFLCGAGTAAAGGVSARFVDTMMTDGGWSLVFSITNRMHDKTVTEVGCEGTYMVGGREMRFDMGRDEEYVKLGAPLLPGRSTEIAIPVRGRAGRVHAVRVGNVRWRQKDYRPEHGRHDYGRRYDGYRHDHDGYGRDGYGRDGYGGRRQGRDIPQEGAATSPAWQRGRSLRGSLLLPIGPVGAYEGPDGLTPAEG